jgi:acylphosphatase
MVYIDRQMQKSHSIIVTGKVQDMGFRSIVEHIGRSFGIPGLVFNGKDGSVKILCSGEDSVIDNFTQTIKIRGVENGAEIASIKEQTLTINIDLPDEFSKVSSDDEIDIGRKLDKANLLLKGGFDNLNMDLNRGFNNVNTDLTDIKNGINNLTSMISEHNTRLEVMHNDHNRGQQDHNKRLEAILEKLANK